MQRKLKIMNHQIDQLKEEITSKEQALVKEHLDRQRVEKEKDNLKVCSAVSELMLFNTRHFEIAFPVKLLTLLA